MTRKLLSAVLLITMLMSFTLVAQAQNPDCQGDITLTYWHHWGGNRIPIMQSAIAAFEVANPRHLRQQHLPALGQPAAQPA